MKHVLRKLLCVIAATALFIAFVPNVNSHAADTTNLSIKLPGSNVEIILLGTSTQYGISVSADGSPEYLLYMPTADSVAAMKEQSAWLAVLDGTKLTTAVFPAGEGIAALSGHKTVVLMTPMKGDGTFAKTNEDLQKVKAVAALTLVFGEPDSGWKNSTKRPISELKSQDVTLVDDEGPVAPAAAPTQAAPVAEAAKSTANVATGAKDVTAFPTIKIVYAKDNVAFFDNPAVGAKALGIVNATKPVAVDGLTKDGWYEIVFADGGKAFTPAGFFTEEKPK